MNTSRLFKIIFLLAFPFTGFTQDLQINVTVDRTQIGLNRQFQLNVELTGGDANSVDNVTLPNMEAFAVFGGSSSQTNLQIANGQRTMSKTLVYYFTSTKLGKFTIGSVVANFEGKEYKSQPIAVEIIKAPAGTSQTGGRGRSRSAQQQDLAESLFFKAVPNKRKVYQGEPVVVEYKLYMRVQVTNYAFTNQPNYGDFWSEEFPGFDQPKMYNETIDGVTWRVATLKKIALFPTSAGKKQIPAQGLEASVRVKERRSRRDLLDSFFDDPFFGRNVTHRMTAEAIDIEVSPLPANKPKDFSGLVGEFSLKGTVDRTSSETNEPVTLKVTVSGDGNIRVLSPPKINFPDAFEVYDPKSSEKINRAGNKVSGSKTFEYLLIPRRAGEFTIPAVALSYFDTKDQKYAQLSTKPVTLNISRGAKVAADLGNGLSKEEVRMVGQDIRFIEKTPGVFVDVNRTIFREAGFWAMLILPLLVLAGGVAYRNRSDHMTSNVAYARSKKAQKIAQKQLKDAKQAKDSGDVSRFYTEAANALTKFIGNKLNVEESALVSEEIAGQMEGSGVSSETIEKYQSLLAESDFQRFAQSDAAEAAMDDFYRRVQDVIVEVEKSL